ncbi:MAG: PAS domain-containing protein [Gallionella sp.]|nr:PAS domain-containing protein [Gallionella sp.]
MKPGNQNLLQLRQVAEAKLDRKMLSFLQPHPGENLLHELMHELSVHKIELEMQNEALRQSQIELEKSRDRYVEFYDFALVGYLTLNKHAMIDDINLPGAALLGVVRSKLKNRRFASFVATDDQENWQRLFMSAIANDNRRRRELTLKKSDGTLTRVMVDCQRLEKPGEELLVRVVLTDLAEQE